MVSMYHQELLFPGYLQGLFRSGSFAHAHAAHVVAGGGGAVLCDISAADRGRASVFKNEKGAGVDDRGAGIDLAGTFRVAGFQQSGGGVLFVAVAGLGNVVGSVSGAGTAAPDGKMAGQFFRNRRAGNDSGKHALLRGADFVSWIFGAAAVSGGGTGDFLG